MNQSSDNPAANKLPEGARIDRVTEAVQRSGYPLQTVVALELQRGFQIIEEWGYSDRGTEEHRALDLFASRSLKTTAGGRLKPTLALLLECKRAELPFIFFRAVTQPALRDFPSVLGLADDLELHTPGALQYVPPTMFLCLSDFPFVSAGPPVCNAFAKSGRSSSGKLRLSGTVPYRQAILPLASASEHLRRLYRPASGQAQYAPCVTLSVCVLDAPMILAEGSPEEPKLTLTPWVRVVRGEPVQVHHWIKYQHHVVDFVHRAFLGEFVTQHLLPFADAFAERVDQGEAIVFAMKAKAPSLEKWKWNDLQPVT